MNLFRNIVLTTAALFFITSPISAQEPGGYQPTPRDHQPEESRPDIADRELRQFAKAVENAESLREESREKMKALTEKYDMTLNEFRQMQRRLEDPTRSHLVSDEDRKKMQEFHSELNGLQQDMDDKLRSAIKDAGMDMQRYHQILSAVQRYDELKEKMQQYRN